MGDNIFDKFKNIEELNSIPKGDMPGDKIQINFTHLTKAKAIAPVLMDLLTPMIEKHAHNKAVVSVCGGSGTGKSEIASLLSYYLNQTGIGSYILSGDNYPHRIPEYNDAERLRVFRRSGLKGLLPTESIRKKEKRFLISCKAIVMIPIQGL
ncbi:zeta toxin family protein [Thermoclostridium stercorarium]|uniref:zeta toxin family protein n=1 Tax=Thermoclostridium stercorarium TaxID=1510 RepID=UPI000B01AEB2|nr:zeta toxin family protein [Thermoclostridium stercorarium]